MMKRCVIWGLLYLILGIVLLSTTVECVCNAKVEPRGTTSLQRSVGEIAELNCDVIRRDRADELFWTKDNEVVSFNMTISEQQLLGKYRVDLVDDLYKLRFKVDANDVGVYNCSCGSSSSSLRLFVAVPILGISIISSCTNSTGHRYKIVRSRPASSNQIRCPVREMVNISVIIDGGCTYPGIKRKFNWHWDKGWIDNTTTPVMTTPVPCFTKNGTFYRYSNISSLYKVGRQCRGSGKFTLYLDDAAVDTKIVTVSCFECQQGQFHPSAIVMISAGGIHLLSIMTVIIVIQRLVKKGKRSREVEGSCEPITIRLVVLVQFIVLVGLVIVPTIQTLDILPSTLPDGCEKVGVEFWVIALVVIFALIGVFIVVGAVGSNKIAYGLQDPLARHRQQGQQRPPHRGQSRHRAISVSSTGSRIATIDTGRMRTVVATTEFGARISQVGRGAGAAFGDSGQRRPSTGQLTPGHVVLNTFDTIPERDTCGMTDEQNAADDKEQDGYPGPPPENHEPMPGKLCIVCDEQPVQVCFPCGHTHTCYHCSLQLALDQPYCPICRHRIRRFSVVYT